MKMCKLMMDWVDARVNYGLAYHNMKFHFNEAPISIMKNESIMKEREKEAREKLKRLM